MALPSILNPNNLELSIASIKCVTSPIPAPWSPVVISAISGVDITGVPEIYEKYMKFFVKNW